jgi:hypothetical protein
LTRAGRASVTRLRLAAGAAVFEPPFAPLPAGVAAPSCEPLAAPMHVVQNATDAARLTGPDEQAPGAKRQTDSPA